LSDSGVILYKERVVSARLIRARLDGSRLQEAVMSEILDYISTWSVLKWVALVLIAGFIGQFGRMLAEALVKRARLKREKEKESEKTGPPALPPAKPAAPADPPVESSPDVLPSGAEDKKALKAKAKAAKKEAKAKQKESGA